MCVLAENRLHSIMERMNSNDTNRTVSVSKAAMKPINITRESPKLLSL
jgi:hypothetical protein